MTNMELKDALDNKRPVKCFGRQYAYVSAIIYRKGKDGGIDVRAELMDKNNNSVIIVEPRFVGV